jgi:hypothetical protein
MKIHKIIFLHGLLLVMLIPGCTQPIQNTPSANIATPTKAIVNTPNPTPTPGVVPTNTITTIPIFSEEEAPNQLLDLLADNGGCRLPCLLGITPLKTTNTEARAIFLPFSNISISMKVSDDDSPDSVWLTYDEGDLRTFIESSYIYGDNGTIEHLVFNAGEYREIDNNLSLVYNSEIFGDRLSPYMLSGILSEFGKPSLVVVHTSGQQITGSGGFELLLLYPDDGIFARYTTQMEVLGTNVRGCPANAEVELRLYPSGDADAYFKSLSETSLGGMFDGLTLIDNPSWKSIDKSTSMSLEQFYETFRQPTDKCIETPLNLWHVP